VSRLLWLLLLLAAACHGGDPRGYDDPIAGAWCDGETPIYFHVSGNLDGGGSALPTGWLRDGRGRLRLCGDASTCSLVQEEHRGDQVTLRWAGSVLALVRTEYLVVVAQGAGVCQRD
jgi:hypothetical protein